MNKLLLSNEAISIAVRDFFKVHHILGVKLVLAYIILSTIYQLHNKTISKVLHEILHQIIFNYQQGNKSLRKLPYPQLQITGIMRIVQR